MSKDAINGKLGALFDAERASRTLFRELVREDKGVLMSVLSAAVKDAFAQSDEREQATRLVSLAELLGELEGPDVADLLIEVLNSDIAEVRLAAGEALEGLAFERFKEVALAVERALEKWPNGGPALSELPYILASVAEGSTVRLLGHFLGHKDADTVAAAIEALVELSDPAAIPLLKKLERDARQVHLDDEEEGAAEGRVSLGALATEACELISEGE